MNSEAAKFVDDYYKEMIAGNAAIFAGAGLSVPAGFVDWRTLLKPLASELDLNINLESDLVQVAQFHVNENGNNRHRLHQAIVEALASNAAPTKSHILLARLPITTYWTTNYDKLIEVALGNAGKLADVKSAIPQLAVTRPRRDAVVYKMHGDVDRPDEAVVTKDDYERYHLQRGAFINALSGDLISKTFLFLGFSFSDPNLEQVLSRVRVTFAANQRRHYAIFRRRTKLVEESSAEFEHAKVRQGLVIEDLKRFNIKSVIVDEYAEITELLAELDRRYRSRTIFVSSAASDFEPWGEAAVRDFMRKLGSALVDQNIRLATGVGLGVGDALLSGAIEELMRKRTGHLEDSLIIRPFPQSINDDAERRRIWEAYRTALIGEAGIAIFLFGNKRVESETILSDGMRREFDIAEKLGVAVLPIGATGSMASRLAEELLNRPNSPTKEFLAALSNPRSNLTELIQPILEIVRRLATN